MKVLVAVKRVIDYNVKVRVLADGSAVETQNIKMSMNPFDEIAVEEAVRLKEAGLAQEVIAVSIGTNASQDVLRNALAIGADRAILLESENHLEPINLAKALAALIDKEQAKIVLMGKQAIDGDNNQTAQILAGLKNWPQATFASKLTVTQANEEIEVTREIDGGLETLSLPLPAIVSTDLRLNTPRYASLPNIMKAKKKPLEIIPLDSLGLRLSPQSTAVNFFTPTPRKNECKALADAAVLMSVFEKEGWA